MVCKMFVAKKLPQIIHLQTGNHTQETGLLDFAKIISMFSLAKVPTSKNYNSLKLVKNTKVLYSRKATRKSKQMLLTKFTKVMYKTLHKKQLK